MKIAKEKLSRGLRNNNPFNIVYTLNSWKGKLKPDGKEKKFERFLNIDYGLRAGFLLLRNAYIAKGYRTVEQIIKRYAPKSENDVDAYINFICEDSPLHPDTEISVGSLTFYWLCQKICMYESRYDLSYEKFREIVVKFNLW